MSYGWRPDLFAGLRLRYSRRALLWLLGGGLCIGASVSRQTAQFQSHASAPGQLLSIQSLVPELASEPELGFSSIAKTKAVRWNDEDSVIHVRVEDAPNLDGWRSSDVHLIAEAFSAWEREGTPVRFVLDTGATADAPDADVVVHWVDHFDGPMSGWTTVTWDSVGKIHHADVRLALRTNGGQRLTEAQRLLLATHEFGHVLGLGHNSDTTSIMSAVIYAKAIGPSDMISIQRLYGSSVASR